MTVAAAKATLRKEIAERVSALPRGEVQRQSAIVAAKLFSLPEFKESQRVSVYLSMDTEIDTEPIVRRLFDDGKKCYVPRYSKAGMAMVKLHSMDDWENLPVTKWNIKQPSLKEPREDALETGGLDLIIVPGVAFTKDGHRLGHGGGYYDGYLTQCKTELPKWPATVAIALKEQVLESVPTTETDVIIDKVLYAE